MFILVICLICIVYLSYLAIKQHRIISKTTNDILLNLDCILYRNIFIAGAIFFVCMLVLTYIYKG